MLHLELDHGASRQRAEEARRACVKAAVGVCCEELLELSHVAARVALVQVAAEFDTGYFPDLARWNKARVLDSAAKSRRNELREVRLQQGDLLEKRSDFVLDVAPGTRR